MQKKQKKMQNNGLSNFDKTALALEYYAKF